MIVKYTPWEKRNLNVDSSVEFYVEQTDTWEDISKDLSTHQETYQVMHIAGGNTDVLLKATSLGFSPVETNIKLIRKLDEVCLPRIYKRFEPYIACSIATEEEKNFILDTISEGTIFSTDKIARDPFFGEKYAGKRYAYWTQDVIDQGAVLLCMKYKGKIAAFDVFVDKSNRIAEAFLGGTMLEFRNSGLGFLPVYFITKYAKEEGFKKIFTGVSSNNIPVLKIHELFDYKVDSMNYCMIKHL